MHCAQLRPAHDQTVARISRLHDNDVTMNEGAMPATARLISIHDTPDRRKSTAPPALPDVPMIRSMEELLAALRARRDQLELTHERLDDISGLPSGYFGKLMTNPPIKNLGWLSLGLCLDALGVGLILVENPDQIRLVSRRWEKRQRPIQRTRASSRK